ncbi:unnamed protein product [Polarella glacialis]|uniref:LRAT domain-containing protein n=1 Tax=Polarella glacialis TaxID=89957 RepID=A0A813H482_POLGL|nr:unnamed protein product [Polarella glacialis]
MSEGASSWLGSSLSCCSSGSLASPSQVLACHAPRHAAALGQKGEKLESGPEYAAERLEAATSILKERAAMILGMNPQVLRQKREWNVFMWPTRRHWALVIQPAGEQFTARIVDDFIHNAQTCFNAEVPSSQFFLVYELLLDQRELFLMLSVKPDFEPERQNVQALGKIGPVTFLQIKTHALAVVGCYRSYSLIGCNCQHFASDLALSLGAPTRIHPDDEAMAQAASDSAVTVGILGASVSVTAAAGAFGTSAFTFAYAPVVLTAVAVTAGSIGLMGGITLVGAAGAYQILFDWHRDFSWKAEGAVRRLVRSKSFSSQRCFSSGYDPAKLTATKSCPAFDCQRGSESDDEDDSGEPPEQQEGGSQEETGPEVH